VKRVVLVVAVINLLIFLFHLASNDESSDELQQQGEKIKDLVLLPPEQQLQESEATEPALPAIDLDVATPHQAGQLIAEKKESSSHELQSSEKGRELVVSPEMSSVSKSISLCYEIGPFDREQDVFTFQDELFVYHLTSTAIDRKRSEFAGYWVFLPAYDSTARARLVVEELKAKGVKDIVRIPYGEEKNTVSLGVYINKTSAESVQEKIIQLGYQAQLKERQRLVDTTWVRVATTQESDLDENTWQAILSGYKTVKSNAIACN